MYRSPSGTELFDCGEPFVAKDGRRWFIMQNYDYEDANGYMGASTEILADRHGYRTRVDAEAALSATL